MFKRALSTRSIKVLAILVSLFSSLVLSGCVGLSATRYLNNKHDFMCGQGDPMAYADGYVDGCSTGRLLAGDQRFKYRQDTLRVEKDALYARGWQEGQINCRNEVVAEGLLLEPEQEVPGGVGTESAQGSTVNSVQPALSPEAAAKEAEMREIWEELRK